ncbi:type IV secretory system conjugative DNA transfer family protein [Escherichia coli]|uniref:hypothetical protein n=1 Tax=Escherichia coli TaxID=562 RepID=UPI0012CBF180|nr:hypothetical protein [Escherichia coli]EAN6540602.1 hypothetical protein [Salmonella enterica]EDX6306907.1 type IV secretory system conjugative DNA transfer family protein [Salmonella enterica subsp. enterica serovar Java]EAT0220345.1 hypothetical protein [Salmonella enterica]EAT6264575.1 hypothetical protein [Salmonella enterica]EEV1955503.1 type IV secretory system conjugative DNA transfer family protein [Escherichia coli]
MGTEKLVGDFVYKSHAVGVGLVLPKILNHNETLIVLDPHAETEISASEKFIDSFNSKNEQPRCLD